MKIGRYVGTKIKAIVFTFMVFFSFISMTSCGGDNTKVIFTTGFGKDEVFTINKEKCTLDEVMVYLTNTQNQYEAVYGSEIWKSSLEGVSLEENVKETVLAKIAQIKSMYLLALDQGVELDENEELAVEMAAEEYYNSLNSTEIELMGVSELTIEGLYREYAMADKVYKHIIEDVNPEISDDEARIITVQHILFSTIRTDREGNVTEVSDDDRQRARDKALEVRGMAQDENCDFSELAAMYSDDPVITYSFGKGEMWENFETTAFDMETGEISNVIETEVGYHIIKCLNTFDRDETDANKLKIVEKRRNEAFGDVYDEYVSSLVRNLNSDLWNEVTLIDNDEVTTADFFDVYEKYFSKNNYED